MNHDEMLDVLETIEDRLAMDGDGKMVSHLDEAEMVLRTMFRGRNHHSDDWYSVKFWVAGDGIFAKGTLEGCSDFCADWFYLIEDQLEVDTEGVKCNNLEWDDDDLDF